MTPEQYERWMDFSDRMALHGWPDATEARKKQLQEYVFWFISNQDWHMGRIESWDNGPVYVCDELDTFLWDQFHNDRPEQTKFENQISCCVRAGFDVAVAPSAGVVGFDVGMLRRMYDNNVPDWIAKFFEPPLTDADLDTDGVWL